MEITYTKGAPTTRLVKHVQRGNFPMILYGILKNLLEGTLYWVYATKPNMHLVQTRKQDAGGKK